jgi:hypothetical protein
VEITSWIITIDDEMNLVCWMNISEQDSLWRWIIQSGRVAMFAQSSVAAHRSIFGYGCENISPIQDRVNTYYNREEKAPNN